MTNLDGTIGELLDTLPGGHNKPPLLEVLRDELEAENEPLLRRKDELLAAAARMPDTVSDDDVAGRFADMVKLIAAATKNADAGRVAKKEVFLEGGRAVDGFFKKRVIDPLADAKKSIEGRLGIYLRAKADRERQAREEADRMARQAAQRAADEAAKAAEAMKTERDLDAAMELARQADEAAAQSAAAAKAAAAKPAEMSRTRGDVGALGTLRSHWTFRDLDRETIPLDVLRPYFAEEDIAKALRAAIKAGLRQIRGAEIYEAQEVSVR